jgi:amidophosphoribosyltransferase
LADRLDGAYNIVLLSAKGDLVVARDPLGFRPLCIAEHGPLFAAESIKSLLPGQAITITNGELEIQRFAPSVRRAHCFFEWIYFANVASTMDGRSVYLSRKALGEELARLETVPIDDDTIVVPVPDTSKAAADSMAFKLGIPSLEGLIRNRYTGRTFIESSGNRKRKAETKYTPLREVLEGKRVLLVEDSIVRSTTMKVLLKRIREMGHAKEIHVRVACPPIVAPCFYGIDMSTISELFAPNFLKGGPLTQEAQDEMAKVLEADSLRYLPLESIARAIGFDADQLCQACLTGDYPSPAGRALYQIALAHNQNGQAKRTYESQIAVAAAERATG